MTKLVRNNKYEGYFKWSAIALFAGAIILFIGIFANNAIIKGVGIGLLLGGFIKLIDYAHKDADLNKQYDQDEKDKKEYDRYQELKDKFKDKGK